MTFAAAGETALLERHARLLFDLDVDGRIVGINEPEADPAPRFWLIRGGTGTLLLARQDIPTDLVTRVADPCRGDAGVGRHPAGARLDRPTDQPGRW